MQVSTIFFFTFFFLGARQREDTWKEKVRKFGDGGY